MKNKFVLIVLLLACLAIQSILSLATATCTTSSDCGSNGVCATTTGTCNCSKGYVTTDSTKPCAYQQKSKLTAFLLSFLVGGVGADWFYLAGGNGGYIAAGVFKLLTMGGFGIWWLVDWIRVLTDSFPDGQGAPLLDWI